MTALASALRDLEAIVGEENFLTATQTVSGYQIDGQRPVAVAMPGSAEEVARLLRTASEQGLSVLLRGSGTHLYLGAPPTPIGMVLSFARMNRLVEYDAEDLTITAEAGTTLGALQKTVGEHGQILPLDPPGPDSATLGGIAATNLSGTMRMRYGSPRDLVIGLRVALADGTVVKTGGKTVKNVAGYELNKLFVSSLGTLGAICALTMRLTAQPEAKQIVLASLPPPTAAEAVRHLLSSRLDIATLEVANSAACRRIARALPVTLGPDRYLMFAGLMGDRESLPRQESEVLHLLGPGAARIQGEDADSAWAFLRNAAFPAAPGSVVARLSVPLSKTLEAADAVSSWDGWWAVARAGSGFLHAGPVDSGDLADVNQRLLHLRQTAQELGGFAVLEAGPTELKREFPIWGENVHDLDLMQKLKETFDPTGVLGCGRFLQGL